MTGLSACPECVLVYILEVLDSGSLAAASLAGKSLWTPSGEGAWRALRHSGYEPQDDGCVAVSTLDELYAATGLRSFVARYRYHQDPRRWRTRLEAQWADLCAAERSAIDAMCKEIGERVLAEDRASQTRAGAVAPRETPFWPKEHSEPCAGPGQQREDRARRLAQVLSRHGYAFPHEGVAHDICGGVEDGKGERPLYALLRVACNAADLQVARVLVARGASLANAFSYWNGRISASRLPFVRFLFDHVVVPQGTVSFNLDRHFFEQHEDEDPNFTMDDFFSIVRDFLATARLRSQRLRERAAERA